MREYNLVRCLFTFLLLVLAFPQEGYTQERYAAFIHGFSFGDDRPRNRSGSVLDCDLPFEKPECERAFEEAGSRWEASGTPDRWTEEGPIDGYVKLKYFDRDLYDDAGGRTRDKTLDQSREDMMERFVRKMKDNAPNAEWVLVGHSQGGIVARLLHEHIRRNVEGVDVEGVLAIASPMQGAKPTTVAYGSRGGYKNVKPTIDKFAEDVSAGLDSELTQSVIEEIGNVVSIDNFWAEQGFMAGAQIVVGEFLGFRHGGLAAMEDNIKESLHSMAVNKKAKSAIGPNGDIISKINKFEDPENYRALLGAERAPVGPRVASGASTEPRRRNFSLFSPPVDQRLGRRIGRGTYGLLTILSDGVRVQPGHEPTTMAFFEGVKSSYKSSADYYRRSCYNPLNIIGCATADLWKHRAWKKGRRAMQKFGSTYSEIINAYRLDRREYREVNCLDPEYADGGPQSAFRPPTAREYRQGSFVEQVGPNCTERTTHVYYVSVPNKTDGLLGTATTTWNPPTGTGREENPNLGPHSILYNDRPSGNQYKQGGTGYNHAEMVYDERRYSSAANSPIDGPSFSEGQRNPPMRNAEQWLEDVLEGR